MKGIEELFTLLLQLFVSLKLFQNENLKMTNPGCRAARWTELFQWR